MGTRQRLGAVTYHAASTNERAGRRLTPGIHSNLHRRRRDGPQRRKVTAMNRDVPARQISVGWSATTRTGGVSPLPLLRRFGAPNPLRRRWIGAHLAVATASATGL